MYISVISVTSDVKQFIRPTATAAVTMADSLSVGTKRSAIQDFPYRCVVLQVVLSLLEVPVWPNSNGIAWLATKINVTTAELLLTITRSILEL